VNEGERRWAVTFAKSYGWQANLQVETGKCKVEGKFEVRLALPHLSRPLRAASADTTIYIFPASWRGIALNGFPESDWRRFRELRQIALERFCKRTLEEVQTILRDGSRTHHEQYVDVFRLLQRRDDELAHAFEDPRRSRMIGQLVAIYSSGLLESEEVERFWERTRATIESLAKEFGR
jgi:hypothetical protein